VPKIFVNGQF